MGKTKRARQGRAIRNDALILDAATVAAAEEGWAGLALKAVARRAGLSQRTMIDRFDDRSELAEQMWRERLAAAVDSAVNEVLAAAGLMSDDPDPARFRKAVMAFARPDEALLAAVDLLIDSQFDPLLRAAVQETTVVSASRWGSPAAGSLTRADAARRAYLVLLCMGLVAMSRHKGAARVALREQIDAHFAALQSPAKPVELPRMPAWHLNRTLDFDTGDEVKDLFCRAVLEAVAEHGYVGATTDEIARRSGYSQGMLFVKFGNKASLFLEATALQNERCLRENRAFSDFIAQLDSPGIADAVTLRALMRPGAEMLRALDSEQMRVGWYEEPIGEVRAKLIKDSARAMAQQHPDWSASQVRAQVHVDYAMGAGLLLLPLMLPGAAKLPYDVVTIPLTADPNP